MFTKYEEILYIFLTLRNSCLCVHIPTLSNSAMYSENPKRSLRLILSDRALQSSLAVVAESVSRVLVVPSMNVTGSMMGFFDLVA